MIRGLVIVIALYTLSALPAGASEDSDARAARLEKLQAGLNGARLDRQRWERVIATQADLAQHPDKLSAVATDASNDLRDEGRSMAIEGFSMGLSTAFETGADVFAGTKKWRTAKQLKYAATAIDATYKVVIADLAQGKGHAEDEAASLDKAAAALKLAVQEAPDKETREEVSALIDIGTPSIALLSKMIKGEKLTAEDKDRMKDVVAGTRAMMLAFIQHRKPEDWIGVGKAVAKKYPFIGEFAGLVAKYGVEGANLLVNLASMAVGGYAWHEGILLEDLADDIFANQQHAAEALRLLLPHARQERDSATRREAHFERLIQALTDPQPPAPVLVPPSIAALDDGLGTPPGLYAGLQATETLVQSSPPMTYHLTDNEIRRREEIARAEREAERERQKAAERAREEAAEREQEQEAAQDRRERASTRERNDYQPRSHIDNSVAQQRFQGVVNNVLPNW